MGSYEDTISVLEAELAAVERAFTGLSDDEWRLATKLVPVDPGLPHWTVSELAGHFDIAIGLTRTLIAGAGASQPAWYRTSFFINPRSEGKTPADMPGVLHETFSRTVAEARAVPPGMVGPGYFAPLRVDEFGASRIVEAVVHGVDLVLALGRDSIATPEGIATTAAILDDLLARRTTPGRPAELSDDLTGSWRHPAGPSPATPGSR